MLLNTIIWGLRPRLRVLVPPSCVHRDIQVVSLLANLSDQLKSAQNHLKQKYSNIYINNIYLIKNTVILWNIITI